VHIQNIPSAQVDGQSRLNRSKALFTGTYNGLIEAVLTVHHALVDGPWEKKHVYSFLDVETLNKRATDIIYEHAINCRKLYFFMISLFGPLLLYWEGYGMGEKVPYCSNSMLYGLDSQKMAS
jgi:hypothetical protein